MLTENPLINEIIENMKAERKDFMKEIRFKRAPYGAHKQIIANESYFKQERNRLTKLMNEHQNNLTLLETEKTQEKETLEKILGEINIKKTWHQNPNKEQWANEINQMKETLQKAVSDSFNVDVFMTLGKVHEKAKTLKNFPESPYQQKILELSNELEKADLHLITDQEKYDLNKKLLRNQLNFFSKIKT